MSYKVWCPELGQSPDDAEIIDAFDAGLAATKWARHEDAYSAEYWIVGGGGTEVCVCAVGKEDDISKFFVSGETDIVYSAKKVE